MKTFKEFITEAQVPDLQRGDIANVVKQLNAVVKKFGFTAWSEGDDVQISPEGNITSVDIWFDEKDDDSSESIGKFRTDLQTFQWVNGYSKEKSGKAAQGLSGAKSLITQILKDSK